MGRKDEFTEEMRAVNRYLCQYSNCIKEKDSLVRRRMEIIKDFDNPLTGIGYNSGRHGTGKNEGSATLPLKLEEIDMRISERIDDAFLTLAGIEDIISFLPKHSLERMIFEYKYIDCWSWEKICMAEYISKSSAIRHWRKGLRMLSDMKSVKRILEEYKSGTP
ncbi:MAG: hypothetical protein LUE96_07350 [Lachnospiraceae bacterium]|nr:hypothetical protein [Lachnospiraceae bacterium]